MKEISVIIDGKKIKVPEGTTVLRASADNGIEIPNLCFDGRVELYGACGLCVVEAEGIPKLLRACSTKLNDGMIIHTESERILRARKTALELLLSDHDGDCKAPCTLACPANTDCQGYVGLIANGEYKEAVKLIKDKIPLPSSIFGIISNTLTLCPSLLRKYAAVSPPGPPPTIARRLPVSGST